MRTAQLAILGVALAASGLAVFLAVNAKPEAPPPAAQAAAKVETADILVAAADMQAGTRLEPKHFRWKRWPSAEIEPGMIVRGTAPQAVEDLAGSITRALILTGDPIRENSLSKTGGGYMSSILPSGRRAVAILIDSRGSTSAGGFIVPNDRVDVVLSLTSSPGGEKSSVTTMTILRNIRVLAIGKVVQQTDKPGLDGDTATLDLDPRQVEIITQAQRTGQLSLALRSIADNDIADAPVNEEWDEKALSVVRHGIASQR